MIVLEINSVVAGGMEVAFLHSTFVMGFGTVPMDMMRGSNGPSCLLAYLFTVDCPSQFAGLVYVQWACVMSTNITVTILICHRLATAWVSTISAMESKIVSADLTRISAEFVRPSSA